MIVTARGLWATICVLLLAACAAPPGTVVRPTAAVVAARPAGSVSRTEPPSQVSAPAAEEVRQPDPRSAPDPIPDTPAATPTAAESTDIARKAGTQTGLASWYGRQFQGRRTASGERYDMHAMTAAHRTLPFGTKVRVRSVATGKEVVVRINDRGPYRHQRLIDLSQAAIVALGLKSRGVTAVELMPE